MDLLKICTWEMPAKLFFGPGCVRQAGELMKALGGSKALIVTDRGVEGAGILEGIYEALRAAGVGYVLFKDVEPNPSTETVEKAAQLYRAERCDCLLAVGGGSPMDAAKAAGALITNPMDIMAMGGAGKLTKPIPPFIAVPTTCGTGSEVTSVSVITVLKERRKMAIFSPFLFPKVALIDPTLLVKLPAPIIAATGMDALCHAIESYINLNTTPITDCLNLQAISMIARNLRPAVANGNLQAIGNMVLASTVAGMGFANTGLAGVHPLSHPITAHTGVPHGVANAILLPFILEFSMIGALDRYARIAEAMGEDTAGLSAVEAARLAIKAVRQLARDVGIPESFKSFGVNESQIPAMLDDATQGKSFMQNPRRLDRGQVAEIFKAAMK